MSVNQKGTQLTGDALNDEVLASTDSIFHTDQFGNQRGLQQFYSPPQASQLAKAVIGDQVAVLDLTAGDGSLLSAFGPTFSYGVEIDGDQVKNAEGSYNAIKGDIQHVYTLLNRGTPEWDGILLNPPFGLQWSDPSVHDGKPLNSAVLSLIYAMRLLSESGQFVFMCGAPRFYRQIADLPEAAGIYAVIECDDLFDNVEQPSVMCFGIHPGNRSAGDQGYEKRQVPRDMLDLTADWVRDLRHRALGTYNGVSQRSYNSHTLPESFKAIQTEYDRRTEKRIKKNREYDLLLVGGTGVQYLPSGYATAALTKIGERNTFYGLNGVSVNYFVQNESIWVQLKEMQASGVLTIEPRLTQMVDEMLDEARKEVLPLYEIKTQQRLGWLPEVNAIKCKRDWPEQGFIKGEMYRVSAQTQPKTHTETRIVESKSKPGEYSEKTFTKQRKVLEVRVGQNWQFNDGEADASYHIKNLVNYFELPDPGTIASKHPEEIEALEALAFRILDTEFLPNSRVWEEAHPGATPYSHSEYQKKDISRLAFKGGGLLSWDMGLGKTLGALLFCRMMEEKGAKRQWLFVAPGDLIPQWQREIKRFLDVDAKILRPYKKTVNGKSVTVTMQQQAHELNKHLKAGGEGVYIVHYEAIATTGTDMKKLPPVVVEEKEEWKKAKGTGRYGYFYFDDEQDGASEYEQDAEGHYVYDEQDDRVRRVQVPCEGSYDKSVPEGREVFHGYIYEKHERTIKQITSKELCPECKADIRSGWNGMYCEGEKPDGSKCGYAHVEVKVKPASSFLSTAFQQGVIVLDEATYIGSRNGNPSKRSMAIRGLNARHKLAMTGTPIKNFVGQAYWILWWCLGNGSKRFGYQYDGGHSQFEQDFSVIEWQMSKGKKEMRSVLPEVSNLAMLWKLLASSCIRRRKEDTGEPLPPKFYTEINTPLGVQQAAQYKLWLKDFPKFFADKYPDAPIVKAGMHAVMAPMLGLNWKLDYALTMPKADPDHEWTQLEDVSDWTPANLRVIELAMALAKEGRKVLIGSHLVPVSKWLADRLNDKGVTAMHIVDTDGTTSVDKDRRAERVHSFQTDDKIQVFCAGVKAIRLGHNLDAADAVILHGLDWDLETATQFVDRVHRRTSKNPVDVYCVLPTLDGQETITSRKWSILAQKGQASDLALDGRLIEHVESTIDKDQVMRELVERGFRVTDDAVDEFDIEDAFTKLPELASFNAEGVIPPRPELPEVMVTEEEGAEALCAFLSYFADKPPVENVRPQRAVTEDEEEEPEFTFDSHLPDGWDDIEAELAAVESPTPEPEPEPEPELDAETWTDDMPIPPIVAGVTSPSESSPVVPDVIPDEIVQQVAGNELMEQMAAMKAQLDALAAENAALKAAQAEQDAPQLSLFETVEEVAA